MLKYIGILILLSLSTILNASEYHVIISDNETGEVQVQKCANENELIQVTNFLGNLNTDAINYQIKKVKFSSINAVKKGGGEGGTD
jgi:hypothetical protein